MTSPLPRPPRRIVLIAGPSGSGKGVMTRRSGLPLIPLDEFYRDGEDPSLPRRFGIVDWDDSASWDEGAALAALTALAHDGEAEIPTYSLSASRRTGTRRLAVHDAELLVAEGIFAAELVEPLSRAGLLADALVLDRPMPLVFAMRLLRDLREARKPAPTLLRRGWALAREQPADLERWCRAGMRPVGLHRGVRELRASCDMAEAERHHHRSSTAGSATLRIAAVCFLRGDGSTRELLLVRKRGTGTFMQVGGKFDGDEIAADCAVRESAEEIGVRIGTEDLTEMGTFTVAAANEPGTMLSATVLLAKTRLPEPVAVRAEIAEHRWLPIHGTEEAARDQGIRLAPLLRDHVLPQLRRLG